MMNYSHLFRCLRVSELVGLNGTIEHYLPHRVAMQFRYDQDLLGSVTQLKHNSDIAWKNYIEVTKKVKLYLPSRLFKADVSARLTTLPPGFPPKHEGMEAEERMDKEEKLTLSEFVKYGEKHKKIGIRQRSDSEKLSGQAHNSASPVAEESYVNMMTSDEGIVTIVGNGCASNSSIYDKHVWELKSRCTTLESMVRELKLSRFI
ncbi:hypothetical protein C1H46_023901 [Malus baccata]|uniref:Aminotransferase-like plant mobile domain-containing protein n=1 Tax=Malus baccata TaxID=106549 RepID=A0A540LVL6_MALBA|nr:hypothetical protein C1H46_023901 [Malus baccata]